MKFFLIKRDKDTDPMLTLSLFVVTACTVKFLFEGVAFNLGGFNISLGHADALTYGALLTPVLSAHSFINTRVSKEPKPEEKT